MSDTNENVKQSNRERMKEIVAGIEDGIQKLFQSEKYFEYLRTMSRFHSYSVNNTVLIHLQMPNASVVAGFSQWKNRFSRHVKKGETGITIIAPTPFKKKVEREKLDPDTNLPMLDGDGNVIMEEKIVQIPMFKPVKVFDVSQTEGKPLPHLAADLTGNVQHYDAFMEALRRAAPVPVEVKPMRADMDGYFSSDEQKIAVRAGMSQVQTISALVHEITHSQLHNYAKAQAEALATDETALPPVKKDRNTEEVEAESVSYAVCQYYGIETGENSFGYIATWSKDRTLPELRASLETITKTANALITGIDKHFAEVCKERGIVLAEQQEVAPEPDAPDTTEKFAADYCDYLEKLYQADMISDHFSTNSKEVIAAELAKDVYRHGHFNGTREELEKIAQKTNSPTAAVLLERLEKLSDAWDASLTCAMEPYPFDDGTGARSLIKVFEPDAPNTARDVIFVGPTVLCEKLMQELNDGATTIRQIRELNQQRGEIQARADALLYDAMFDQQTLLQVNGAYYLHIQSDRATGFDYTLYDVETLRLIDGGQFGVEGLGAYGKTDPMEAACWAVCTNHGIVPQKIEPQPMDMLETIQEANAVPESEHSDAKLPDTTLDEYPMPDSGASISDLENYGYQDSDLIPITKDTAFVSLENGFTVYNVIEGGGVSMCMDDTDIDVLPDDALFAVTQEEWEDSREFREAVDDRMKRQEEREAAFLDHGADCFAIYQVKEGPDQRDIRFEPLETLKQAGETPKRANYDLAYTSSFDAWAGVKSVQDVYDLFNLSRPADYGGRSPSVSDIIAVKHGGVVSCHYCDSMGFVELPHFIEPDNYLKNAELAMEDDANRIDTSANNNGPKQPTVAELEAQVKAGQTISLLDLANAVNAERKSKDERPSVLARLKQQPPAHKKTAPKKSAERDR